MEIARRNKKNLIRVLPVNVLTVLTVPKKCLLGLCLECETFIRGVFCPNLFVCLFVCVCVCVCVCPLFLKTTENENEKFVRSNHIVSGTYITDGY